MPDNEILLKIKGDSSSARAALSDLDKSVTGSGKTALGVGSQIVSGLAALGMGAFLKESVDAALQMEAATARLRSAVEATGASWAVYGEELVRTVDASALASGFDDKEMAGALSNLTMMTGDAATAMKDLSLAQDLARATGMGLEAASKLVAKVEEGRIGIASRVLPFLKSTMSVEEAMAALRERTAGQMSAFAETSAGQIARARVALDQFQEAIGYAVLPAIGDLASAAGEALAGFAAWPEPVRDATVQVGALAAALVLLNLALASVGIKLSVGGIVKGIAGIGVAASEAAIAVRFLAAGESVAGVVGLGGAAGTAALGVTALSAAAVGLGSYLATKFVLDVTGATKSLEDFGRQLTEDSWSGVDPKALYMLNMPAESAAKLEAQLKSGQAVWRQTAEGAYYVAAATWKAGEAQEETTAQHFAAKLAVYDLTNATKGYTDILEYEVNNLTLEQTAQQNALQDKIAVTAATQALADAVKKYGKNSNEAKLAQLNLTAAQNKSKDSAEQAAAANAAAGASAAADARLWDLLTAAIKRSTAAYKANPSGGWKSTVPGGKTMMAEGGIVAPAFGGVDARLAENGWPETAINWSPSNYERNLRLIAATIKGIGIKASGSDGVASGGGGVTIAVDARGATDPRAVESAARRGVMAGMSVAARSGRVIAGLGGA